MSQTDTAVVDLARQICESEHDFALTNVKVNGIDYRAFANAPATLGALYLRAEQLFGELTFIVYGDERISYAQAVEQARRVAARMLADGLEREQPVAIAMRNYPEWIIAYMAITLAGGVAVPMNGWWQTAELDYAFADCQAKLVFADAERARRIAPIAEQHSLRVITVRESGDEHEHWDAYIAGADLSCEKPKVDADDLGTIFYTSGSTGKPKGVMTTHRASINAIMTWALLTVSDKAVRKVPELSEGAQLGILMSVPLFHVTGCNAIFLLSMLPGQKIVLIDRWNPQQAVELIEHEKLTSFNGVPSMSWELLKAARASNHDISTVNAISGGGAARPASHVPEFEKTFTGAQPSVGYGLTETSALGTANSGNNYQLKPNSAGVACFPLVDLRIVDEQGQECACGKAGEIWLKSVCNMRGYLNNPEASAEIMHDGFIATGDVGYVDEENFLFIVDRIKDIVIRGGENISCLEVENAIYDHPSVSEAAVFGLPDEKLGEKLVAVVCSADTKLNEASLREFLAERLAYYKVPVEIELRSDQLPRTASGKIFKRELRAAALAG